MKYKSLLVFSVLLAAIAVSCSKENASGNLPTGIDIEVGENSALFILNQGAWPGGSTLDLKNLSSGAFSANWFAAANPDVTQGLGNTGNDMAVIGGRLWALMNGSNQIAIINPSTGKLEKVLDVDSPRYIIKKGNYAYVTSYGAAVNGSVYGVKGKVYRIDPATYETKTVEVGYQPDGITALGEKLYVANSGGYQTDLTLYQVPFIFANFNGTQGDVEVVTHEAGHAFAYWMNRSRIPTEYAEPTAEACEVHSMSMEFFGWKNAEGFFGPDARKFMYSHLAGAVTFIPYGTMVDHFQHSVYENPDMTPAERHGEWKRLLGIYMPWMKLDGDIPFYAEGEGWQRQSHIYECPFYYIDYCLAQTVSLEFWAMLQSDPQDAWRHYMAYTRQGGSRTFVELLRHADLKTPFDEACLKTVCEAAAKWLDAFDLSEEQHLGSLVFTDL